jgi:hypothetical protein
MIDLSRLEYIKQPDSTHHVFKFNCPCGRVSYAAAIADTAEAARERIIPLLIKHVAAEGAEEKSRQAIMYSKPQDPNNWNADDLERYPSNMVPRGRFELPTSGLKVRCSTD